MGSNEPLRPPSPWPPPEFPQASRLERVCWFVPVVGWIVGFMLRCKRLSPFIDVLASMERQIKDQFTGRRRVDYWPEGSSQLRIVRMLEAAIARERFLPSVCLHPYDLMDLACWGEDDLSMLIFSMELEKRLGIVLSHDECMRFFWSGSTVSTLVDYCLERANVHGSDLDAAEPI